MSRTFQQVSSNFLLNVPKIYLIYIILFKLIMCSDFNIFLDTVNAEEDVLMKATKLLLLVLQYGLSLRC